MDYTEHASPEVARRANAMQCKGYYDELIAVGIPPESAGLITAHWHAAGCAAAANANVYERLIETLREISD